MNVSIELTMSPLTDDFRKPVQDFIKKLRASDFEILENPLSTQVYGEYDKVMPFLTDAIRKSMQEQDAVLFYLKMVRGNRSGYKPDF